MKTAIDVLKQREQELLSHMEGADGEVWEYCTSTLSDVQNAIQQLEKDQLKIENLKAFINKQIESNDALAEWESVFSSVKYDESTKILNKILQLL